MNRNTDRAMFQTLANVQSSEAIRLQQCIDNRGGNLRIGLRSITYTIRWWGWWIYLMACCRRLLTYFQVFYRAWSVQHHVLQKHSKAFRN